MDNNIFDFCVVITTYNRPKMLENLIENILKEKKNYNIQILVFDDGSTQKTTKKFDNVKFFEMFPNMGKKKYYLTINATFKVLKKINSKYYIYLPDDVFIIDNFFEEVKNIYESIKSNKKICLSILTDERVFKGNWGYKIKIIHDNVIQTQWNDLCFICEKIFFEKLNYEIKKINESRWSKNPNLSSGVGYQITKRLNNLNFFMYHTKNSLVIHGEHESKMNFSERKKNKLITL